MFHGKPPDHDSVGRPLLRAVSPSDQICRGGCCAGRMLRPAQSGTKPGKSDAALVLVGKMDSGPLGKTVQIMQFPTRQQLSPRHPAS